MYSDFVQCYKNNNNNISKNNDDDENNMLYNLKLVYITLSEPKQQSIEWLWKQGFDQRTILSYDSFITACCFGTNKYGGDICSYTCHLILKP